MPEKGVLHGDAGPQYLLCVIVNIVSFGYGTILGWLAPMQPLLQDSSNSTNSSTDFTSPLGPDVDPLSNEDISWIVALFCIGAMGGTLLFGYLPNKIGRKKTLITSALTFLLSNLLIVVATNVYYLFWARVIAGIAGAGLCIIVPMYIGETAEDNIRGTLGSYFGLLICLGILFSFIVGSYTSYLTLGLTCVSFPILFLICSIWLPETPVYSLLNNRTEEALNSLIKLRGNHRELIENELNNLVSSVKQITSNEEKMSMKDMFTDHATRKALFIGCFLLTVQVLSGLGPILNFMFQIFKDSKTTIPPHIQSIIVAVLQVVGAVIATGLIERAGRKLLLLLSSSGMALALMLMSFFFYIQESGSYPELLKSLQWLPLAALGSYLTIFNLGVGPIPWILFSEIFKTSARGPANSICVMLIWVETFFLLKFYADLNAMLGNCICFAFFALCSAAGTTVTYFFVPETKGKSLEEILRKLGEKDKRDQCQKTGSKTDVIVKKLVI